MFKITDSALEQIEKMLKSSDIKTIRVTNTGNTCRGMCWEIKIDSKKDTDFVYTDRGITILVDEYLNQFFTNPTIEYRNTINGLKFVIK